MNININEIIEKMKQNNTKVQSLNNGWNIKEIGNHREYELFNDEENQIYVCSNVEKLKDIIDNYER